MSFAGVLEVRPGAIKGKGVGFKGRDLATAVRIGALKPLD